MLVMVAADPGRTGILSIQQPHRQGRCVNAHLADEKAEFWEGWQLSQHFTVAQCKVHGLYLALEPVHSLPPDTDHSNIH